MKSWIYIGGIGLLGFMGLSFAALAQSQRYPTDAELQHAIQEFRQTIPQLETTGMYGDRRTPAEREARDTFVEGWAEVDPAIAPFLGAWNAIEETLYIYPSTTPGEVCVLDVYLDLGDFYRGQVREGKIYTSSNLVFLLDSGYLSSAFVYDDQADTYQYANPMPLPDSLDQLEQYYPDMIAAFRESDCWIGLPETNH